MNDILIKISELRKQIDEFKNVEEGSVYNTEAYSSVKNSWLQLCIFEDKFHSIISQIRCTPGLSSTIIIHVSHTESIQALNTLLALISNVNVLKYLDEFCDSVVAHKENKQLDIIYAMQSFKMNRCKYQMQCYLSSLYELIENNKRDIEMWSKTASERINRKSNMHM